MEVVLKLSAILSLLVVMIRWRLDVGIALIIASFLSGILFGLNIKEVLL